MSCRYYDEILIAKLQRWVPEKSKLRVLKPSETKRFYELTADDEKDKAFKLPLIAVSRNTDLELLSTIKSPKSFDGLRIYPEDSTAPNISNLTGKQYQQAIANIPDGIYQFNVLPIRPVYQIDIYTKTSDECEEYVRNFLFKLINNPALKIEIPYNGVNIQHVANIRVLSPVSDTSDITERIFSGQFYRWTIQLEIHDAFLFSIPFRKNWRLFLDDADDAIYTTTEELEQAGLELSPQVNVEGELEPFDSQKYNN